LDGTWRLVHLSSVYPDDKIGVKGAQFTSDILWRGAALYDEQIVRANMLGHFTNNHQPGGIVSAQVTANSDKAGSG
jgi:hypothetical protein